MNYGHPHRTVGQLPYPRTMTETDNIRSVLPGKFPALSIDGAAGSEEIGPKTFSDLLADSLNNVQELQAETNRLSEDLALGKPVELHQVMLAATKAQIAMELIIEMRNRLIEAYQEISRMPV